MCHLFITQVILVLRMDSINASRISFILNNIGTKWFYFMLLSLLLFKLFIAVRLIDWFVYFCIERHMQQIICFNMKTVGNVYLVKGCKKTMVQI